jgi:hypothetical protein
VAFAGTRATVSELGHLKNSYSSRSRSVVLFVAH